MNFFDRLFPGLLSKARSVLGFNTIHGSTDFNNYSADLAKLNAILQNPALLKVVSLQCDLFSLGQVCVYDKNGKKIEDDPFLSLMKSPNPFQSRSQFLWDFMFWTMMGTSYCYADSAVVDKKGNKLYFLIPFKLEWPQEFQRIKDKLIFSDAKVLEYEKMELTYRYDDGSTFKFPKDRLITMFDLTNGIGNFFKSPSRIDALYKIISNSEKALDAKNINVRYSGKFLVASTAATTNSVGLGEEEKIDIVDKMDTDKTVWPLRTMVKIQRFVDDMASLKLDEVYLADYYLIGSMYNIPRDVLEAYVSSTFENQEKARMSHVSYTLQPKGNDWMDSFEKHFGYTTQGKNIFIEWSHLPFMQVFEKEHAEVMKTKVETLNNLLKLGVSIEEANEFLDTEFTIKKPKADEPKETETATDTGTSEGDQGGQGEADQGQSND